MDEYVSKEALINNIGLAQLHFVAHGENKSLYDIINEQTAADVEPVRHARWIVEQFKKTVCSYCEKNTLCRYVFAS